MPETGEPAERPAENQGREPQMDADLDISLGETRGPTFERRMPPDRVPGMAVSAVGAVRTATLKIYVSERACRATERHAATDTSRELGGVLLGRCCEGPDGLFVQIEDALPASAVESHAARITFTHETWARFTRACDERRDNLEIVGWYHTHPGFGIFLSHHDLFIHQHFFNQPWHVALVIDPLAGERGFFQWSAGRVRPVGGWYLFGTEEEAEEVSGLSDRLRVRRGREEAGTTAAAAVGAAYGVASAAFDRRLEALRSWVLLVAILGFLLLGLNLILLMNVMRTGEDVREASQLAEAMGPLGRGRDLLRVGRVEEAVGELRLATLRHEWAPEAHLHLSRALAQLERYDEAREAISQAWAGAPARYGRERARFLAADLKRQVPWDTATAGVAAQVVREGLAMATRGHDEAALAIAANALDDRDTDVVLTAIGVLRAVKSDTGGARLQAFVQGTRDRAARRAEFKDFRGAARLMALARAAAPDDLHIEDEYWHQAYRAGLADLNTILEKSARCKMVADLVLSGTDPRARRRVVEAVAARRGGWVRDLLEKARRDEDRRVRDGALDGLVALAQDEDWRAASVIVDELAAAGTPDEKRALIKALGHTKQAVAIAPLAALVKAPDGQVDEETRLAAVKALAELGRGGGDALADLPPPGASAGLLHAISEARAHAAANALYDQAYRLYHAGELDQAKDTLGAVTGRVTGNRSPRWLRRAIAGATGQHAKEPTTSRPPTQPGRT